jgi:nucleotide-binding universal stress UspA family protein
MWTIKTILHPTDFSKPSEYALQLACALARDYHARLVVLHVALPPVVLYGEGVIPVEPQGYWDQLRAQLQRVVSSVSDLPVESHLVEGEPAAEILRLAAELPSDLIVLGTHGRTGLSRLLMGSVAEQVVRKAACPVLTVKMPLRQTESHTNPKVAATGNQ